MPVIGRAGPLKADPGPVLWAPRGEDFGGEQEISVPRIGFDRIAGDTS